MRLRASLVPLADSTFIPVLQHLDTSRNSSIRASLEKEGRNVKSYRDQIKEGHDHRLCYLRTKLTNGIDPDATNFDKS